ncbi:TNT domain-containing protein [Xenorhabdus bovienii]|uniref:TNT domain-containing protein n=1 Tax=Xenorhabdus bovienii TaxID=40576 RepID=UPI003DA55C77
MADSKAARESSNFKDFMWYKEWPPNRGFYEGKFEKLTLQPDTRLDRYSTDYGTFVSPEGIPYSARALKPGSDGRPYTVFVVKKPITADAGEIAPWFGYPGRGTQYDLPAKVKELIDNGSLEKVSKTLKGKPIPLD